MSGMTRGCFRDTVDFAVTSASKAPRSYHYTIAQPTAERRDESMIYFAACETNRLETW